MQLWNTFAEKHPAAAKWVREGGLFVIVSNLVTVFKYLLLQFLPAAFSSLPVVDFGWPGIPVTLFGETFQWNILGYDSAHGGLPYFCAYMVAMVVGECINFPIQRNFVFRSKGNLAKQIAWYVVAFCLITCIVNSINCVWVAVAGLLVPDFIYNIGTTMLNGDILMLIFFFVNKIIFPEREAKKYRAIPHNSKCRYSERGAERCLSRKAGIMRCCHRNNFRYYVQKPSAVRRGPFCMQV